MGSAQGASIQVSSRAVERQVAALLAWKSAVKKGSSSRNFRVRQLAQG